jgi:hypothetical protein
MAQLRSNHDSLRSSVWLGSIFTALVCCGCSGSDAPPTALVQGTVTMNGKPLPNIGVVFFPTGAGPLASGNTNDQGQFELTTVKPKDGAVIGQHRVAFGAAEESESEYARKSLPARYGSPETSQITAEVVAGEVNQFSFELTK